MNNMRIIFGALVLAWAVVSCKAPCYLPSITELPSNPEGAYINIKMYKGKDISGELIAVDSNVIFVLNVKEKVKGAQVIPIGAISSYDLEFAKKGGMKGAPLLILSSIAHGYFAVFTLPLNIISSIALASDEVSYYYGHEITYQELKKFSRFPQGIPPSISIADIR